MGDITQASSPPKLAVHIIGAAPIAQIDVIKNPGTKIKVTAFQAKDGEFRGSTRDIEFPDGRKLSLGSSAEEQK